jgi:hypothetical protein
MQSVILLSVKMLSDTMLSATMQSVTMLSVTMLSVTMLSVTMLRVVAPCRLLKISLVVKFEETKTVKRQKKVFFGRKRRRKTETTFGRHDTLGL